VLLVADDSTNDVFSMLAVQMRRGTYNVDTTGAARPPARVPAVWVPASLRSRVAAASHLTLALRAESFVYPSANVVAVARGRDSKLAGEYVLFSGHHDHDGVRIPVAGDSIWNGADDNASVSVAMLAIGRAFVKAPGRRSALFVWHGAEERGLLGSRWYVWHPTVPRDRIVAVLNGDMIGRNAPDSAALLGAQPPHRNSTALVSAALDANARVTHFALDTVWDRPTHPEGWYFRSDHLPYARAGIPSLMFSTLLHPDYHTPRDEASRIDVGKLARMTRWIYATGWAVAERAERPALDPGFRLER
jgi:Zn-dependent M28 family amino/carboxypeptidase